MKFTSSAAVAALALCAPIARANNDTCNPLFSVFIGAPGFRINSAVAEAVVTSNPVVLTAEEGKFRCDNVESSCCSAAIMEDLAQEFQATREYMEGTIGDMRNLTFALDGESVTLAQQLDESVEQFGEIVEDYEGEYKEQLEDLVEVMEKLVPIIKGMLEDTSEWIRASTDSYATCLTGALRYRAGLTCLACNADWEPYMSYDAATGVTATFAKSTCDTMEENCGGIWEAAEDYMQNVREHVISALEVAGVSTADVPVVATETELCGDIPCRQYVCETMVHGFIYSPPNDRLLVATAYVAVGLGKFGEALGVALSGFVNLQIGTARRDTSIPAHVNQAMENVLQTSLAATDMIKNLKPLGETTGAPQRRQTSDKFQTEESEAEGAYDPVDVGANQASGVDNSEIQSGNGNSATRGQVSVVVLAASAILMAAMM